MTAATILVPGGELDGRVAAFEAAWAAGGSVAVGPFLPPAESPEFPQVLAELIRIDLEFRSTRGESPRFASYRPLAPHLFRDPAWVGSLAFEEYRQRLALGESPRPDEYAAEYGVNTSGWPAPKDDRPPAVAFPAAGETVGPFRVLRELGRGSFGRVYLAEQTDLAGRPVAVKLSTRFGRAEPETLARLQHTHIVPVYSAQRVGPFQAVVMPFLGATTLADVLTALHQQAAWPASGSQLADTVANRASRTKLADGPTPDATTSPDRHLPLEQLRRLSFPEAVLWIGWKLAEALAHAHARGILHRDVKPANVLVTDDGQPMLLDFNLASDAARDGGHLGGTPAYMAPEQTAALRAGRGTVDHRADIFSLGLTLAELLIGKPPASDLRSVNPAVSPSTEAIILKCLDVDPAGRYASAEELADEFRRQLAHLPLRATREPSARERFDKWRRRHPVLASAGSVAALAAVLVLVLAGTLVARQRHVRTLTDEREAGQKLREFQQAVPGVVHLATSHGRDPRSKERLDGLLARYGVADGDDWFDTPSVARLPEAERRALVEQLGDLLLLRSRTEADAEVALRFNERSEAAYRRVGDVSRAVWDERHRLAKKLGRNDEATRLVERAMQAPAQARDWYFSGLLARDEENFGEAIRLFELAVGHDPRHYWAWLALGDAWTHRHRDDQAEGCFNACVALRPDLFMGYFNRGLCRTRRGEFAAAVADFTRVIELDDSQERAYVARGVARQGLKQFADAEADFTKAIDAGSPDTRLYFQRAGVRTLAGNAAGAAADRAEGLRRTPTDAAGWVVRGQAKAGGDAAGALADFEEAIKLDPTSFAALMNKANVLESRGRVPEAVAVLTVAIDAHPDQLEARSSRAVLLARQGDHASARTDAEACVKANPGREVAYQLAGVYAQTSRSRPDDVNTAYQLLKRALRDGYGLDEIPTDPDLNPIRGLPGFREIVQAAEALRPSSK